MNTTCDNIFSNSEYKLYFFISLETIYTFWDRKIGYSIFLHILYSEIVLQSERNIYIS